MVISLGSGPVRDVVGVGGQRQPAPLPAGGYAALRARLATRNWGWVPWGCFKPYADNWPKLKPFSWAAKRKALSENKRFAILNVARGGTTPFTDNDLIKTFKRIKEVSAELDKKPGKTLEQCADNVAQIKTEIANLVAQRDSFRKSSALKHETVPKLDPAARAQLLTAKMTQEIAEAITFDCTDAKNAANAAAAKVIIDRVANAVAARYTGAGFAADVAAAAAAAAQPITNLPLAPGATAVSHANVALDTALSVAKTAERQMARVTYFRGSSTFNSFAKKAEELDTKLRVAEAELFDSLCNAEDEVYEDPNAFAALGEGVFAEHSRVAEAQRELDAFRLSLGLPALRKDKIEASAMYSIKKALTDNAASKNEMGAAVAGLALEWGAYALFAAGTVPAWVGTGGSVLAAAVFNLVVIKLFGAWNEATDI